MEFRLLGSLEVLDDEGRPVDVRGAKPRAVLAMLLLNANQTVSVEQLIDALWEDQPPASARQTVQFFIHRLRKALGGPEGSSERLVTQPGGYLLQVGPEELDLDRFEAGLRRAAAARAADDLQGADEEFERALGLWHGPALADFSAEAFAQPVMASLESTRLVAMEDATDVRLDLGRHADLVGELEALVRAFPLRERLRGQLILALYRSGRQVEALEAYRATRRRFVDELGIEPAPELRRLEHAILTQDSSLDLPSPATLGGLTFRPAARAAPSLPEPEPEPDLAAVAAPEWASDQAPAAEDEAPAAEEQAPDAEEEEPAPEPAAVAPAAREERKIVTVLVAGLVEAKVAGALDPEDQRRQHTAVTEMVRRQVGRYGGAIHTAIGGTVLAVFGLPRAREDDPERAVRAALAACHEVAAAGTASAVRIGVGTGEAIVSPRADLVDEEALPDQAGALVAGLVGGVVDVAAALVVGAPAGGVLVTPETYRATVRAIEYRQSRGGTAWQPIGPRSRIGVAVSDDGVPAALVERDWELGFLKELLGRVQRELEPQLVTIVGAPGIGKTRLVAELGRFAEGDEELITWRQGRCMPSEWASRGLAFWALAEIVKAQAGIVEEDPPESADAKLHQAVAGTIAEPADAAAVEALLRPLLRLDAVPEAAGDATPQAADPGRVETREGVFAAWTRFFEALAADRPLVLVFENLQWADDDVLDFIDRLVEQVGSVPMLVVCTTRPEVLERRPRWGGGKPNLVTISLGPLSAAGGDKLLDNLLAAQKIALPPKTREAVLERAAGNPLFLEEYVRMLRDVAAGPAAAGWLASQLAIPETVQQLITARIDALQPEDKQILQDLAVIGELHWPALLAAVSEVPQAVADAALERLDRQEFLRRIRTGGGAPGFAFRHALIADVAYHQLLRQERAGRHRRVAEWLESEAPGRAGDRVEQVADHYERALDLAEAAGERADPPLAARAHVAFLAAADQVAATGALDPAIPHYERAVDLLPGDDPGRAAVLLKLGRARVYAGKGGLSQLREARDLFLAAGDRARAAEAEGLLDMRSWLRGDVAARAAHLDDPAARAAGARPAARPSPFDRPPPAGPGRPPVLSGAAGQAPPRPFDQGAQGPAAEDPPAVTIVNAAVGAFVGHDYRQAMALCERAVGLAVAQGDAESEGTARTLHAQCRVNQGDLDAIGDVFTGLRAMEAAGAPLAPVARTGLAEALLRAGRLDECVEVATIGQRRVASANPAFTYWAGVPIAEVDLLIGRWEAVRAFTDRALARPGQPGTEFMTSLYRMLRGAVRLGRGDHDGAMDDTRLAVDLGRQALDRPHLMDIVPVHARVLLAAGFRDAAVALVEEHLADLRADPTGGVATTDLGIVLADLGYGHDVLPAGLVRTAWLPAVLALLGGNPARAVDIYAGLGARVPEADARARLATRLAAAGRHDEARQELGAAADIFQQAGATAYLRGVREQLAAARPGR
jgi:DNA-binding SARP family transcriptional activator